MIIGKSSLLCSFGFGFGQLVVGSPSLLKVTLLARTDLKRLSLLVVRLFSRFVWSEIVVVVFVAVVKPIELSI